MKRIFTRSLFPLLMTTGLLLPRPASAQTSEWQNASNSNWSTGTWYPSAPAATGTAIIQGSGTAIVNVGASITVGAVYVGYSRVGA
ncbi:MAG: hypothetical protein LBD30_06565, partial [Verrucomicrobiales bacterium]|nr:hypothetical protein [Verrucomicrobiales bacterium]